MWVWDLGSIDCIPVCVKAYSAFHIFNFKYCIFKIFIVNLQNAIFVPPAFHHNVQVSVIYLTTFSLTAASTSLHQSHCSMICWNVHVHNGCWWELGHHFQRHPVIKCVGQEDILSSWRCAMSHQNCSNELSGHSIRYLSRYGLLQSVWPTDRANIWICKSSLKFIKINN